MDKEFLCINCKENITQKEVNTQNMLCLRCYLLEIDNVVLSVKKRIEYYKKDNINDLVVNLVNKR